MIVIDGNTIGNAVPIKAWIHAMERALMDTAGGRLEVPPRSHVRKGENTLYLMPCFGEDYFSTKLVSVFPKNLQQHEPVIYGSVVLNDGATGKPLAILDGSKLTAMRTAAVGSLGIKYLAPEKADKIGIIGLGIQGFHQALFACSQRPVRELRILDRSIPIMKRFRERFQSYFSSIRVIPCRNAKELCRESEIIITATGSQRPVVPSEKGIWEGKTLIGIGSYRPDMREFPDEAFERVQTVYVDTLHSIHESGDLVIPLGKGILTKEQIVDLSELISGNGAAPGGTRFFKSVGMAAFDLYGARLVYENTA